MPVLGSGHRRDLARALLARALGRPGMSARLQVTGRCMMPLIREGDWVTVLAGSGRAGPGDVVLARDPSGALVCHRVLARTLDGFLLAGDRTVRADAFPPESVLGRVRAIERPSGRHFLPLRSRTLERCLASLHLFSFHRRGSSLGRLVEPLRRRLRAALTLVKTTRAGIPA